MNDEDLICPICQRASSAAEPICPLDHGVPGGVRAVTRGDLEATPRSKRHLLGTTINDTYIINGYLGSGGFGAVYKAEQTTVGRDVALKLLMTDAVGDAAVIERFRREARTAAALLDPNIVTLFDFGETRPGDLEEDHALWIAMELVVGPTLKAVLAEDDGLGLWGSVQTGVNILRGLTAAHRLGVVHRDLKPGNVLIDQTKGRPHFARLFDFGIASLQGSSGHTTSLAEGGVLGTPKYMAPEQWKALGTTLATDVYAFGVMLAEMLLGRAPIPKMELVKMAQAHCRGPRPRVKWTSRGEAVPPALTELVERCMAIEADERFPSASEALEALDRVARSLEVSVSSADLPFVPGDPFDLSMGDDPFTPMADPFDPATQSPGGSVGGSMGSMGSGDGDVFGSSPELSLPAVTAPDTAPTPERSGRPSSRPPTAQLHPGSSPPRPVLGASARIRGRGTVEPRVESTSDIPTPLGDDDTLVVDDPGVIDEPPPSFTVGGPERPRSALLSPPPELHGAPAATLPPPFGSVTGLTPPHGSPPRERRSLSPSGNYTIERPLGDRPRRAHPTGASPAVGRRSISGAYSSRGSMNHRRPSTGPRPLAGLRDRSSVDRSAAGDSMDSLPRMAALDSEPPAISAPPPDTSVDGRFSSERATVGRPPRRTTKRPRPVTVRSHRVAVPESSAPAAEVPPEVLPPAAEAVGRAAPSAPVEPAAAPEPEASKRKPRPIWPWTLLTALFIGAVLWLRLTGQPPDATDPKVRTAAVGALEPTTPVTAVDPSATPAPERVAPPTPKKVEPPPPEKVEPPPPEKVEPPPPEKAEPRPPKKVEPPPKKVEPPPPKKVEPPPPKKVEPPPKKVEPPPPKKVVRPPPRQPDPPPVEPPAQPPAADADYLRGVDAMRRGASTAAQRFFTDALKKGLTGAKAADARRRISELAAKSAMEDEF